MGRGVEYFFTEGNRLENEALINPYTEKAKELLRKGNGKRTDKL